MIDMSKILRGARFAAVLGRGAGDLGLRQQADDDAQANAAGAGDARQPAGFRRQCRRPRLLRNRFDRAHARSRARRSTSRRSGSRNYSHYSLHHRRPCRRARHARIQHRARRPPRPGGARLSVSRGIAANRMRTISYGKERPVAVCNDISCWSQNRRAVTVLNASS